MMKKYFSAVLVLVMAILIFPVSAYADTSHFLQYQSGRNTSAAASQGNLSSNQIRQVIYDQSGNKYITGTLSPGATYELDPSEPGITVMDKTAYVSKYDASGSYVWTKFVYTAARQIGRSYTDGIAADANGHIYWSGVYNGTVTLDGQNGSHTVSAYIDNGNSDQSSYMMRLSATDGSVQWETHADTSTGGSIQYGAIAIAPSGAVYSNGNVQSTVLIDSNDNNSHVTANGSIDSYIFKFSDAGVPSVLYSIYANQNDAILQNDIKISNDGVIYVNGYFNGSINAMKADGAVQSHVGNTGGYVASIGADGVLRWAKYITEGGNFNVISLTNDNGIVVGGSYSQGSQVTGLTNTFESDAMSGLVIKFDSNGDEVWYQTTPADTADSYSEITAITVDTLNRVYAAGDFSGTTLVGLNSLSTVEGEDSATYVTRYSSGGTVDWSDTLHSVPGSSQNYYGSYPEGLIVTDGSTIEMFGSYNGNIVFNNEDGTQTTYSEVENANGYQWPYFLVTFNVMVPQSPAVPANETPSTSTTKPNLVLSDSSKRDSIAGISQNSDSMQSGETSGLTVATPSQSNGASTISVDASTTVNTKDENKHTNGTLPLIVAGTVIVGSLFFIGAWKKRSSKE